MPEGQVWWKVNVYPCSSKIYIELSRKILWISSFLSIILSIFHSVIPLFFLYVHILMDVFHVDRPIFAKVIALGHWKSFTVYFHTSFLLNVLADNEQNDIVGTFIRVNKQIKYHLLIYWSTFPGLLSFQVNKKTFSLDFTCKHW